MQRQLLLLSFRRRTWLDNLLAALLLLSGAFSLLLVFLLPIGLGMIFYQINAVLLLLLCQGVLSILAGRACFQYKPRSARWLLWGAALCWVGLAALMPLAPPFQPMRDEFLRFFLAYAAVLAVLGGWLGREEVDR